MALISLCPFLTSLRRFVLPPIPFPGNANASHWDYSWLHALALLIPCDIYSSAGHKLARILCWSLLTHPKAPRGRLLRMIPEQLEEEIYFIKALPGVCYCNKPSQWKPNWKRASSLVLLAISDGVTSHTVCWYLCFSFTAWLQPLRVFMKVIHSNLIYN